MATKSITIDVAAHDRLSAMRREGESFNMTITRVIRPPFDIEAHLARIENIPLSKKAEPATEEHLGQRRKLFTRKW